MGIIYFIMLLICLLHIPIYLHVRLIAEKINKNERKANAEIHMEAMGSESGAFWELLGTQPSAPIGVGTQ